MKKITIIAASIAVASLTLALSGCENEKGGKQKKNVEFTSVIDRHATRAAIDNFETGGKIGVYMLAQGAESFDDQSKVLASNAPYVYKGGSRFDKGPGQPTLYFPEENTVDFVAYYPWSADVVDAGHKYAIDVTRQVDFLYSDEATGKSATDSPVQLKFHHKLAKLKFALTDTEGVSLEGISARITGMNTTATFDLETGVMGEASTIAEIPVTLDVAEGAAASMHAIVLPGTYASFEIVFTLANGQTARKIIENKTYAADYQYTCVMTFSPSPVQIKIVSDGIEEWGGGGSETVDPIVKTPVPAAAPAITLDRSDESFNGVAKNSDIALSGSITTDGQLATVKITTTTLAGESTDKNLAVTADNNSDFPIAETIPADETLAGITITATDINGKETVKEIKVCVGYKYYRVMASGNGSDNYETETYCFFSASLGTTLGYTAYTLENADKVDVAFATWSSNGQMCILSICSSDLGNKCNHPTYGTKSWIDPAPSTTVYLRTAQNITRSTFDGATISDILAETAPTTAGSRVMLANGGNMDTPADQAIVYTTKIGGATKRVLLAYDEFEEAKPNASASTFWIKVKVEL